MHGIIGTCISPEPSNVMNAAVSTADAPELSVCIAASFTAEPLEPILRFWLMQLGLGREIGFAPYNQLLQQLLDPGSALAQGAGVNVILVRLEDFARLARAAGRPLSTDAAAELMRRGCDELATALATYARRVATPTILWLDASAPEPTHAAHDARAVFGAELVASFAARVAPLTNIALLEPAAVDAYPVARSYDARRDEIGHIPFTPAYFTALGTAIARRIHALKAPPVKVIALDCDNTLWQGVVGEDGASGIKLPRGKLALQRAMIRQQQLGTVLCLLSKNVEEDVMDVFEERTDMLLRREHLVSHRVNWSAKSQNIAELARELNLGLDSFVFIDDNPVECAEMRAAHPQVLTLQLPADEQIEPFLAHLWVLDCSQVTEEDRQRTQLYKQNAQRVELEQSAADIGAFLQSLQLHIEIVVPESEQIARVAQLTQRTNQFNFSTRRRSQIESEQLAAEELECLRVNVRDRFGDYGLVGVIIFGVSGAALRIDSFMLSCRVLGRGVEHAMLAHLGGLAAQRGLTHVEAVFVPSKKNQPALRFLQSLQQVSVEETGEATVYRLAADAAAACVYAPGAEAKSQLELSRTGGKNADKVDRHDDPAAVARRAGSERGRFLARIATELCGVDQISVAVDDASRAARPALATEFVRPRSGLERDLCEIWGRLLHVNEVGVLDDFTAHGGTSLMAAQLFVEIDERYGTKLPMTTILEAPTVATLAAVIAAQDTPHVRQSLRVLRGARARRQSLFLVHDGEGETLLYLNLARRLPNDIAVYGLEPLGDAQTPIVHTRITEMAAHYIQEVKRVEPVGPYLLGGMCAGGNIAYEMAQQLEAAGEKVALLALLDSADTQAQLRPALMVRRRVARFFSAITGRPVPDTRQEDAPLAGRCGVGARSAAAACDPDTPASLVQRAQWVRDKARNFVVWEATVQVQHVVNKARFLYLRRALDRGLPITPDLQHLSVRDVYELAAREYRPQRRVRAQTTLFRASGGEGSNEAFVQLYRDPCLGWEKRCESLLHVHDIRGGHSSMLQEPAVAELADHVARYIDGFGSRIGAAPERSLTT